MSPQELAAGCHGVDDQQVALGGLDHPDLQQLRIACRADDHRDALVQPERADVVAQRVENVVVGDPALAGAVQDDRFAAIHTQTSYLVFRTAVNVRWSRSLTLINLPDLRLFAVEGVVRSTRRWP